MEVPYARTYWIVDGLFLAGAYPDSTDQAGRVEKINALLDMGIRRFVNLMEYGENPVISRSFVEYQDFIHDYALLKGINNIELVRFPIAEGGVVRGNELLRILTYIEHSIKNKLPVFVHSFSGRGRTGVIVGAYLIWKGLTTNENVFNRIEELRKDEATAPLRSPQTAVQMDFLKKLRF